MPGMPDEFDSLSDDEFVREIAGTLALCPDGSVVAVSLVGEDVQHTRVIPADVVEDLAAELPSRWRRARVAGGGDVGYPASLLRDAWGHPRGGRPLNDRMSIFASAALPEGMNP